MTKHLIPAICWGHLEIACVAGRLANRGRMDPKWEWSRDGGHATVGEGSTCKRCAKVVRLMLAENERMLRLNGVRVIEEGGKA